MDDTVGFSGGRQVFAGAVLGQLKSIPHNSVHTFARKDSFLNSHFQVCSLVQPTADLRVLTFIVLPHHDKIDVFRCPVGKGRLDAGQEPDRADIDILLHLAANWNQQTP